MPRKAAHSSLADAHAAPGGVAAVDRALSLLTVFRAGDRELGLAELAQRAGLHKSTSLRLIASLEHAGFLRRNEAGRYTLGATLARLHGLYAESFSLEAVVMPVLRELVDQTRESAAFHVRQGEERLCLYRVDSPQLLRDHLRAGDVLPLTRGAGGRVLMAFSGAQGAVPAQIRRDGVAVLSGDRVADLTGVSAPVFGVQGELRGALTLTLPTTRYQPEWPALVKGAAGRLSRLLGAPKQD